jgi:hypothetical protein
MAVFAKLTPNGNESSENVWKTDRGRLYIIMGPPDEREEHPGSYEIWTYNNVDDSTDKLIVSLNAR